MPEATLDIGQLPSAIRVQCARNDLASATDDVARYWKLDQSEALSVVRSILESMESNMLTLVSAEFVRFKAQVEQAQQPEQ